MMKKLSLSLALLGAALLLVGITNCHGGDKVIDYKTTPATVQTFVALHFSGIEVSVAKKDGSNYEVYLQNGVEIEFYKNGDWKEVDGKTLALPQSVVDLLPAKATAYLATSSHKDMPIKAIAFDNGMLKDKYKVELLGPGDIDLVFDKEGNFVGYDD